MRKKTFLAAGALLLPLAGCLEDSTAPGCEQVPSLVSEQRGDTVVTMTGLRYIETEVGTGITATSCRGAAVTYVGSFTDGTEFDDGSFTFTPGFGQVIPGFEQGVIGMKVGGERRVIVPPSLGYGSQPYQDIPANSTLVFDIQLVDAQAPAN